MNGSANPLLDKEEHILKLGESFEKRPKSSFHTIRCESENKFVFLWMCMFRVSLVGAGPNICSRRNTTVLTALNNVNKRTRPPLVVKQRCNYYVFVFFFVLFYVI